MVRLAWLALGLTLLAAACNRQPQTAPSYSDGTIALAGRTVYFELADDPAEQLRGLSSRERLEENQAMLFIFRDPAILSFWMKDMRFAIDIIWLRGGRVVDITHNAQPQPGASDQELASYSPAEPSDHVLELPGGWAARNGLKIGDSVEVVHIIRQN